MTPPTDTPGDPWAWPDESQSRIDLAHHLEQAARALRDGRAVVRRSATSTTTDGPHRLDVDLSWSPQDPG